MTAATPGQAARATFESLIGGRLNTEQRWERATQAAIDVFLAGDSVSAESIREALAAQDARPAPDDDALPYEPGSVDIPSGERDVQEFAVQPAPELAAAMAGPADDDLYQSARLRALGKLADAVKALHEAEADRDDYAARLKAADQSWAKVAAERDQLRDLLREILNTYAGNTSQPGRLTSLASPGQRDRWRKRAGLEGK